MTATHQEHPRAAELEAEAARHLDDCPFSIPTHLVPRPARTSITRCVCYQIRLARRVRAEVFGDGSEGATS